MNQESLTFDLANDCSRFVTGYFEIISTSSPHIYHSALALAAKTSMVRRIYESYAQPFVRIVHGLSMSWDSNTATRNPRFSDRLAVWSPCNRFIAVGLSSMTAVVLDSATLQQLQIVDSPQGPAAAEALVFSPDSRMLTCYGRWGDSYRDLLVVSWDLQTGGVVSAIERQVHDGSGRADSPHIAYFANGKMVAVHRHRASLVISIFDVVSGLYMHDVRHGASVEPHPQIGSLLCDMWTQEESLRFSTIDLTAVTIWEVGFTPEATSAAVETLYIPDNFQHPEQVYVRFLPASRRHVLVHGPPMNGVLVWDGQDSRPLAHYLGVDLDFAYYNTRIDFSHDGCFLACATTESEIGLWKESSTGYVLHGRLEVSSNRYTRPLLSPNGELIIDFGGRTTRLWHTRSFTTPPSRISNQIPQKSWRFLLEFHPDRPLAVVGRWRDNMAIVLDLESGVSLLTINAGMAICGLGVVGNAVVIIGDGKVITWDLPGNFLPGAEMDVEDSSQTINFSIGVPWENVSAASISPDLRYVALATSSTSELYVFDTHTGHRFDRFIRKSEALWFTPCGPNICYLSERAAGVKILTVAEDGLDDSALVVDIRDESLGCPWGSSRGYQVTDDRWVVGPGGKRLLMLPPLWQSSEMARRVWKGQFLALLHEALPEPVVIELEP